MHAAYPVHYRVDYPARFTRLQLAGRTVAFLVVGLVGLSFGTVFSCAYLGLPLVAAIRLGRGRDSYLQNDGPRIIAGLRWFAAISAWAGLIAEELPMNAPDETVRVDIEIASQATPSSAMWRIITGLPSGLVLAFLCWIGVFVWLWSALSVLLVQRVGRHAFAYLAGLQRWSIRLLAYQAGLVDEYPPFSFSDTPALPSSVALTST